MKDTFTIAIGPDPEKKAVSINLTWTDTEGDFCCLLEHASRECIDKFLARDLLLYPQIVKVLGGAIRAAAEGMEGGNG